jgi:chromodomain-helicase-DNA-binding protein 3/chromodomain-helicase-DNA-binding protein 4
VEKLNIVKNDLNDYYLSGFKFTSLNFETVEPQIEEEDLKERQGKMDKYWETLLDGEARMLVEKE